jgi:hypothetical protein
MSFAVSRGILVSLLLFLGLSAIGVGALLLISPSGKLLGGLPLELLDRSPFTSFFYPGLILFVVLGIVPCALVWALFRKPQNRFAESFNMFKDMHWAWSFTIYIAFALIIWIQVETIMVQSAGVLQTFYLLLALPIIFISLLPEIRAFYKNEKV